jgi:hypothetical protein
VDSAKGLTPLLRPNPSVVIAENVIPESAGGGYPESRKNRIILDPGSRPALRDLAGMTNCNSASMRWGFTSKPRVGKVGDFDSGFEWSTKNFGLKRGAWRKAM